MAERIWTGLPAMAAEGLACVICGRGPRGRGRASVPVGRSHTGSQVFACVGECAARAAAIPEGLAIPMEALTAGGAAFLATADRAGGVHRAYPDDLVAETVEASAPLVVAAELRRVAAEMRTRATDLDPAGGESR
ncbi:MAG: hypothetical protein ACRDSR_12945 [Pseudonocardiaceae bacterium]